MAAPQSRVPARTRRGLPRATTSGSGSSAGWRESTRQRHGADRTGPGRADTADLDDTPDLYLYAGSAALGRPTVGEHPAADLLERLGTECVVTALRRLPADYRVLCTPYYMADLSYEEMARVLEYPVGTVRARLHRARKMLQKSLWATARAEQDDG